MSAIVSRINRCNCACLRVAFFYIIFLLRKDKKKEQRKETDWVFGSGGQKKKAQDETFEGIVMPTWRRIEVVGGREAKT